MSANKRASRRRSQPANPTTTSADHTTSGATLERLCQDAVADLRSPSTSTECAAAAWPRVGAMSQDANHPPAVPPAESPAGLPGHGTDGTELDQFCRDQVLASETEPSPDPGFNQVYRDYWWPLLRFVKSIARADGMPESRLDAEGVVQDTFRAAFKTWTTIKHPKPWIYKVAARKVRRRARWEWFQDRMLRQRLQAACSQASSHDPAYTYAVAGAIVDRIMTLPTNQRIATYLRTVLQWTGPEIAEVLDIPPDTAHVRVSRGIKAVRRHEDEYLLSGATAGGYSYRSHRPSAPPLVALIAAALAPIALAALVIATWSYPKLVLGVGGLIATAWLLISVRQELCSLCREFWSYGVVPRITIPRPLAVVAVGLLPAAIAGLAWFVLITCGIPATWVIKAIFASLIVAGIRRPFQHLRRTFRRRQRRAFWRRQRRRRWK